MQSTRKCSVDDCDRPARVRGWCQPHYSRVVRTGTVVYPCTKCGADLPIGKRGSAKRCDDCMTCGVPGCSRKFRENDLCNGHAARAKKNNGNPLRPCDKCGADIPLGDSLGTSFCSERCAHKDCSVEDCERKARSRGFCTMHYKRITLTGNLSRFCKGCGSPLPDGFDRGYLYCSDSCRPGCIVDDCGESARLGNGMCYRHGAVVRARGYLPILDFDCAFCGKHVERSYGEKFHNPNRRTCDECVVKRHRDHRWFRDEVRDSGFADCGICGDPIDLKLPYPDPMSLSIDHIVPVTRGGSNHRRNLAPVHLVCNFRKGNRMAPGTGGELTLF